MSAEQRKDARKAIELEVAYRRMNAFFVDYTRNVSRGGMFVRTDTPLPRGTLFFFQLRIPGRPEPFELTGEVVHAGHVVGSAGMGVRFVWNDDAVRAAFERQVESLMTDSLGASIAGELLGKRSG